MENFDFLEFKFNIINQIIYQHDYFIEPEVLFELLNSAFEYYTSRNSIFILTINFKFFLEG